MASKKNERDAIIKKYVKEEDLTDHKQDADDFFTTEIYPEGTCLADIHIKDLAATMYKMDLTISSLKNLREEILKEIIKKEEEANGN